MSPVALLLAALLPGADIERSADAPPAGEAHAPPADEVDAPPAAEVHALPAAEVHGRSRTLLMLGSRPYFGADTNGMGVLEDRRFIPILEDLSLDARPGVEGLSIGVDAWTMLDAGQRFLGDRLLAELTEGFLAWNGRAVTARAGRLFLFTDVGRGDRIDGVEVLLHPQAPLGAAHLTLDAFAGVPVIPLFGEEPIEGDRTAALRDPLLLAPRAAAWKRPGDLAVGALAGMRLDPGLELALGFTRRTELAEVEREAVVGRVRWASAGFEVHGFGVYDVVGRGLEDAELAVDRWLGRGLRLSLYGRSREPALLLPSTSIFSVFSSEIHRELGLEGELFLTPDVRISSAGEVRRTEAGPDAGNATGYRAYAALHGALPTRLRGRGIIALERLQDGFFGRYDYLRAGGELPLTEEVGVSGDGALFLVRPTSQPGAPALEHVALRASAGLTWRPFEAWRLIGTVRTTHSEAVPFEAAVIGRLEWSVDHVF